MLVPGGPGSLAYGGADTISWARASVYLVLSCPPLSIPVLALCPALQSQSMLWNGGVGDGQVLRSKIGGPGQAKEDRKAH